MRISLASGKSQESNAEGLVIIPVAGVKLHTNVENLAVLETQFRGGQNTEKYGEFLNGNTCIQCYIQYGEVAVYLT